MKKIIKITSFVLTGLLLLIALAFLVIGAISVGNGKMVKVFGYSYSIVVTSSMEGDREDSIQANDIIVIKDIPFWELEVDDIIVFYNPVENKTISHRIYEIDDSGDERIITTWGDNRFTNPSPDTYKVKADDYIGKVIKSNHFLGIGSLLVNGRIVFFIALVAVFGYVIISEVINILKILEKRKMLINQAKREEEKQKMKEEMLAELRKEILEEKQNENNN